ncbi:MAG: hypothetical protein OEV80_06270, partial [candidate division Zixibacteria bacterium]|nr:hypothetical protein [candidate division Zixibacteria bacterium]
MFHARYVIVLVMFLLIGTDRAEAADGDVTGCKGRFIEMAGTFQRLETEYFLKYTELNGKISSLVSSGRADDKELDRLSKEVDRYIDLSFHFQALTDDASNGRMSISCDDFEKQLKWIVENDDYMRTMAALVDPSTALDPMEYLYSQNWFGEAISKAIEERSYGHKGVQQVTLRNLAELCRMKGYTFFRKHILNDIEGESGLMDRLESFSKSTATSLVVEASIISALENYSKQSVAKAVGFTAGVIVSVAWPSEIDLHPLEVLESDG